MPHKRSLIRIFAEQILTILEAKHAKFLHADNKDSDHCANAHVDLSLHWVHMSESTISQLIVAHTIVTKKNV